jgi:hypothetical protein
MVWQTMNERIKQIAEQAGYLPDMFGIGHWDMPECKKFAELIVRDLIDSMIKRYGDDDELPIQEIKLFVKEHFGVEE